MTICGIPIESNVTTIVGANEPGKSHLLTAIVKGISGNNIKREDFCRYSQYFTVEMGERKLPDFGFEWTNLSSDETTLGKLVKLKMVGKLKVFFFSVIKVVSCQFT